LNSPDQPDFATRLVNAIKSAMGLSGVEGQPIAQSNTVASPMLRAVFIATAAIMLALWGWSLTPVIQNWNNPNEDGFSLIPGFYATITVLPLGLIMLAGGISGKGKAARRARVGLAIAVALVVLMMALETLRRLSNATGG
jgi:hypothetical protein